MRWKLVLLLLIGHTLCHCAQKENKTEITPTKDYIRPIPGKDEPVAQETLDKGEVLISYNGCYDCHRKEVRSKGPAYSDIAKRYPRKKIYISLLSQKILNGSTGSWGNPVMPPHPNLRPEEASAMATYILSLK